ncbi:MAG: SDR family oxidoreductase [Gemmatimonadetes bacterium]|nr:SDR family oxidoreductase [Gemmatimonadota bacterium]
MGVRLDGRSVLVTGGSRGIGRAVVEAVAEAGGAVHVFCRDPADVATLARGSGGDVWPTDLGDEASVWTSLDQLQDRLGGPPTDIVNSAGAFALEPLAETSVATFDRMLAVNLRGTFLVLRALLPALLQRGSGRIVNVGSVAGRRALPGNGAYGASKFGVRGLHEVLVEELRGSGVAATLLEPSATDTSLWDALDPDGDPALPPRSAMLRPADVADTVLFVLSRPEHVRLPLLQIEAG